MAHCFTEFLRTPALRYRKKAEAASDSNLILAEVRLQTSTVELELRAPVCPFKNTAPKEIIRERNFIQEQNKEFKSLLCLPLFSRHFKMETVLSSCFSYLLRCKSDVLDRLDKWMQKKKRHAEVETL